MRGQALRAWLYRWQVFKDNKLLMLDQQVFDFSPEIGINSLFLLAILVILEAVLSADNAIALASISRGLAEAKQQRQALNIGLLIAFVLRMALILTATWVIRFWQFELLGALYLLWLVFQYYKPDPNQEGEHRGPRFASVWQAIPMIALTDLAFSLDSVTTAIAISSETWLVLTGATLGIITLRFMAGLFIRLLQEYTHLEDAGYITVGLIGLRLLMRVIDRNLVPPEWLIISSIALLFIWGFSERNPDEVAQEDELSSETEES